jgi:hypothetical protein
VKQIEQKIEYLPRCAELLAKAMLGETAVTAPVKTIKHPLAALSFAGGCRPSPVFPSRYGSAALLSDEVEDFVQRIKEKRDRKKNRP